MSVKSNTIGANALGIGLVAGAIGLLVFKYYDSAGPEADAQLLNVSYDPTRRAMRDPRRSKT